MMGKYKQAFTGKNGLMVWGALAVIAAPFSASAAQSDVQIEQIGQGSAWAAPNIGQIVSASSGNAFIAQAQPSKMAIAADFQASLGSLSYVQSASAEQLSSSLSSSGAPVELAFLGFGLDLGSHYRSGLGSSITKDASGNVLQQEWRGEDNLQFALQEGTGNRALQQQYGARNVAVIFQRGNGNVSEILQLSDQGVAALLQNGDRNRASITQGSAGSFASVSQTGIANIVAIRQ